VRYIIGSSIDISREQRYWIYLYEAPIHKAHAHVYEYTLGQIKTVHPRQCDEVTTVLKSFDDMKPHMHKRRIYEVHSYISDLAWDKKQLSPDRSRLYIKTWGQSSPTKSWPEQVHVCWSTKCSRHGLESGAFIFQ
jgi:hypothetical protein